MGEGESNKTEGINREMGEGERKEKEEINKILLVDEHSGERGKKGERKGKEGKEGINKLFVRRRAL